MIYADFVAEGCENNSIFDLSHPLNRDDCYYGYWYLRRLLAEHDIELNTPDVNLNNEVSFELHMDARKDVGNVPAYVLLIETPQIKPNNSRQDLLDKYRKVFTWNDDLVDGQRNIKINFRNKLTVHNTYGWAGRERLCCMISGNKSVGKVSSLELYSERVNTVRWFEQHAPHDFDLFGTGWNFPASRQGLMGRVIRVLQKKLPSQTGKIHFPSYRGRLTDKLEALQKYRFSICYENVRDLSGYITEKIFDCFFAGCIPVYWGASNINKYIPESCFIDRRKFSNHEALYQYMSSMTEPEYICYQKCIADFLTSDKARPFSTEVFAEIISNTIVSDRDGTP